MRKRRVILLGATGSIGASAIKVATSMPDRMHVVGIASPRSCRKLAEFANFSRPEVVCLVDPMEHFPSPSEEPPRGHGQFTAYVNRSITFFLYNVKIKL
jgi:1-deoxy-D-xylulose 5-phosphate reductoisomerase